MKSRRLPLRRITHDSSTLVLVQVFNSIQTNTETFKNPFRLMIDEILNHLA